ncbi:hypothetical protein Poly51_59530 [Rubripirellula tenax]|uniref:Uncharacterized protein n=1 Tax=Rubripirellula tenax TaxID=2528015 RepID=A0A5C6E824_9BACT|nr:hypothetical protein [Rubripirellula tenax]TWU44684.1 hypothetical protein Poly51_59530 [Rubripirellula tenax]
MARLQMETTLAVLGDGGRYSAENDMTAPIFEQRANMHRVAFILGAACIDDLITWADEEIDASPQPPNALIDLSLGRKLPLGNVIALLNELAIETNDLWSTRRGLSLLADKIRSNEIETKSAIMKCYEHLRNENLLYDDAFIIFVTLEDDVSLIRDGIFGPDRLPELRDEFIATLDQMERETRIAE